MKRETFKKAEELNKRIKYLSILKMDLRPKFCNGVGVCAKYKKNNFKTHYIHNFWSTHVLNTDDDSLIMEAGIKAMYDEVCKLLEEAEKELEELE